jgi:hypothetical protein
MDLKILLSLRILAEIGHFSVAKFISSLPEDSLIIYNINLSNVQQIQLQYCISNDREGLDLAIRSVPV